MIRLRNTSTGVIVNVDEDLASRLGPEWVDANPIESGDKSVSSSYGDMVKADLIAEIDARNEGRDEADQIKVAAKATNDDLIAALEADDANPIESGE